MNDKLWFNWAQRLQSIAQAGLEYSKDKYDIERFAEIREISVQIMSKYTEVDEEKIKKLFANEKGYQTPKVDVRCAVFKDDKILLVREKLDGLWSMPGGWAEVNLTVKENAVKECMEESGAVVQPLRIIAILDRNKNNPGQCPYGIYKIFVLCKYIKGDFIDNIETSERSFFEFSDLPKDLSVNRNTLEQFKLCFNANKDENFIPIFD